MNGARWSRLKRLRHDAQIGQGEFARLARISQGYMSQLESETHIPSIDVTVRIARVLEMPLEVLLGKVGYTVAEFTKSSMADELIRLRRENTRIKQAVKKALVAVGGAT